MADKRSFATTIVELPWFYKLSAEAQALYFHLCMSSDDEGFCADIQTCMMKAHAEEKNFQELIEKRFILPRQEGVVAIKHWWINNSKHGWKPKETIFRDSKEGLYAKGDGSYTDNPDKGVPLLTASPSTPQTPNHQTVTKRIEENGIEVNRIEENKKENKYMQNIERSIEIAKTKIPYGEERDDDDELF